MADPAAVSIRDARMEDAPTLADYNIQMARETENKDLNPQIVLAGVQNGLALPERCRYFVAEVNQQIVGQAMITFEWSDWRDGELWWLQSVYVHPEHRSRGIFKRLYRHIESLAHNAGRVRGLRLYVEEDNATGQKVYSRLGMIHAGYHVFEREF